MDTRLLLPSTAPQPSIFGGLVDWAFPPAPGAAHVPTTTTHNIIENAGYTAQTHNVTTEDGYILTLHRISGKVNGEPASRPVVFMQHGLEDSSACWVLMGPTSPAIYLAERGYDVWLGNFRGNLYSRSHTSPARHPELPGTDFWQFSWDEMAKFDLPAQLNFVIAKTEKKKIYYVGHSMGTTTFLAMNSLDPTWAAKVELAILLAPVAYVDHMQSDMRLFAPYCDQIQSLAQRAGVGEFLPSNWTQEMIASAIGASWGPLRWIMRAFLSRATGDDRAQLPQHMLPLLATQYPAGTSIYTVLQYAQGNRSGLFCGMEWGSPVENQKHHDGHDTPPPYLLENVNTKIALFWGDNDWLAAEEDVIRIRDALQNLDQFYRIPYHGWNHIDHLYANEINRYQNEKMLELLEKHHID